MLTIGNMNAKGREIYAKVARLVTPEGKIFPEQQYLMTGNCEGEEWTFEKEKGDIFPFEEANRIAHEMDTQAIKFFAVVCNFRDELLIPRM